MVDRVVALFSMYEVLAFLRAGVLNFHRAADVSVLEPVGKCQSQRHSTQSPEDIWLRLGTALEVPGAIKLVGRQS